MVNQMSMNLNKNYFNWDRELIGIDVEFDCKMRSADDATACNNFVRRQH